MKEELIVKSNKDKFSIDKQVYNLKLHVADLGRSIHVLTEILYPILTSDHVVPPSNEQVETKGKLDSELFNINQNVEYYAERIKILSENITTRGEFEDE